MKIIAHRCGTDRFPQLTIEGARNSKDAGADYIELDIRFTKDNVPVVCHDPDCEYLFGSRKSVRDITIQEYLKFRNIRNEACKSFSFEEFLEMDIKPLLLDVKETGDRLIPLLDILREYDYEEEVIIGVRSLEDISVINNFNPDIKTLIFLKSPDILHDFLIDGISVIRIREAWVSEGIINEIHSHNKQVFITAGVSKTPGFGYTTAENVILYNKMGVDGILLDEIENPVKLVQ